MKKWWEKLEKRFKWGVAFSVFWLIAAFSYALIVYGWHRFWCLPPNEMGDFFAGASAPLAFLWLVLGYMQQGDEIKETRVEIKRQADSIEATELHSKRGIFFTFSSLLVSNLRFDARRMYINFRNHLNKQKTAHKMQTASDVRERLPLDPDAFVRSLTTCIKAYNQHFPGFYSDEHGSALINRYCDNFEGLVIEARLISKDGDMISSIYDYGAIGDLYGAMCLLVGRPQKFARRTEIKNLNELLA